MIDDKKEELTDKWIDEYKPIPNHISSTSGWEIDGVGIMFETYGAEVEFVSQQPDNHVWTWIDGDEGTVIVAGMAYVNRIGYFVTEKAWTDLNAFVEVDTYDMGDEDDEEGEE